MFWTKFRKWLTGGLVKELKQIGFIGAGFAGWLIFDQTYGCFRQVTGFSMCPTINNFKPDERIVGQVYRNQDFAQLFINDIVFFTRSTKDLDRGDVVLLKRPKTSSNQCKRVVALAGDTVVPVGPAGKLGEPVVLKEGEVWLESDAGLGFADSGLYGPVAVDKIDGVGNFVISPANGHIWTLERKIPDHVQPRVTIPHQTTESSN